MVRVTLLFLAVCIVLGFAGQAVAESADVSTLLCAVIKPIECGGNQGCAETTVEGLDIPQFVRVDMAGKTITGITPSGEYRNVSIRTLERVEGEIIMQGIQKDRAWSIVVGEQSGKMTFSASSDKGAFVIFGACTAL